MRGKGAYIKWAIAAIALAQLPCGAARAEEVWNCAIVEEHHFSKGEDVATRGGGPYLIQVRPPVINLLVHGRFITGFDLVENSGTQLTGERRYPLESGGTRIGKIALDKRSGDIRHTGISRTGDLDRVTETLQGACMAAVTTR